MRILPPTPFTFEGGKPAVLLLHGFTGSTHQMKALGRFLHTKGYTVHAPLYTGHGGSAEDLLTSTPNAWWQCAVEGYTFLQDKGHQDIAVVGISMGGVFACKLAALFPVTHLITMSTPMLKRDIPHLLNRFISYGQTYKEMEAKSPVVMNEEMDKLKKQAFPALADFLTMVDETKSNLSVITAPTLVMQGRLDEAVYQESAPVIYERIASTQKAIRWYEQTGHMMTTDQEKTRVFEDVYAFLNSTKDL